MDPNLLNQESRAIWEQNAAAWDEYMGAEGRSFQKILIGPTTERLLHIKPDELVLDVACGAGIFSRRLAQLGARVVACDFSESFIERARARTTEYADRIDYRVVDATDEAQLLALGERRFDAAVCTMAMMDMPTIEPLLSALNKLLKPSGRFVFSVQHPCFNNSGATHMVEMNDQDGVMRTVYSIKVSQYLHLFASKGLGIETQPVPQYYFHRPLHILFNTCFRAGFVMDALEEPGFDQEPDGRASWLNNREIPPVLIARLRLA
jgi:2-polyprenyl-3-methyl-5-hydroxy-6-metoxy-1,4-benzoquinol methylase